MKHNVKIPVLIIALLSIFSIIPQQLDVQASSNNLIFDSLTIEDGLSQNIINCIVQDHYGYLWFGTTVGLNKYDGITFEVFTSDQATTNSLYNSEIRSLYEDNNGLWIGTSYGLYLYHHETDMFTAYLNDTGISGTISSNGIRSIFSDSSGVLWVGTSNGLNRYNPDTDTFISYLNDPDNPESISNSYIVTIYEDSTGVLWVGTSNGLNKYNPDTDTFISYFNDPDISGSISNNYILSIYEDSRSIMWIGTNHGLDMYVPETDSFYFYENNVNDSYSISGNIITSICEDNAGYLWIGTRTGLNRLNVDDMTFQSYMFDTDNPNGLNGDSITALYKDDNGIIWIGTTNGINKLNLNEQFFKYYTGALSDTVSGILDAGDGSIWLWAGEGLVLFNYNSESVEAIYNGVFKNTNYKNSTTCDICLGNDGCIWFGTVGNGLKSFNPATNEITTYLNEPDNENSLLDNIIISLYSDHSGVIWIATSIGLCSFDPETQQFTQYQDNPEYPYAISHESIYSIYETFDYNIWFGTESEVYMLDRNAGKISLVLSDSVFEDSVSLNKVETIYQDSTGLLWLGVGYDLYSYDMENCLINFCDLGENSLQDFIFEIIEDESGNIWFTNRQGLYSYSTQEGICTKYGLNDGLVSTIFCEEAGYITESGELMFGTTEGLVSFYPDDITTDTTPPDVLINGFKLIDKDISFEKPVEDIEEITLSYSDNSFEIDFIALDFNSPLNNEYAYFLAGFDEKWQYCSAGENSTKYTNIPSGEYTFKVIAANSDGVWNNEGDYLKIIITPPFWQEWWFIMAMVAAAVLAVVVVIKLRTHSLDRHAQELKLQVEERTNQLVLKSEQLENELENRTQFTRAMVHELKTPLTAMMGSSELLIDQPLDELGTKLAKNINRGANNLKRRIDELLDIARSEMGTLSISCTPMNSLNIVREVVGDMTHEASKNGQSFSLELPDSIPFILVDNDRLRQILFNLIGNAIKYNSAGGIVDVSVKQDNGSIVFEIQDQGVGMSPEEQKGLFNLYYRGESTNERLGGLGIGLSLSKTLIELHGGRIWVKSQKGKGSTFYFSIPLMKTDIHSRGVNTNGKRDK
jgi:signal transduction histidine kinase/ligand-binding sensor domain-containing protein